MYESFTKALRWVLAVLTVVLGLYGFYWAEQTEDVKPLAISLVGFGMTYLMSGVWKDVPGNLSVSGSVLVLVLAYLSQNIHFKLFVESTSGYMMPDNFFIAWSGLILLFVTPFMTFLIHRFD